MVASPYDSIVRIEGIPSVQGPTSISAVLLDGISAVPYEGIWVPWLFTKQGSLELSGVISTLSCQLYGTNVTNPLNSYTVTVGGSATNNDVLTLNVTTPSGLIAATYTVAGGNTTTQMAAGLATFISTSNAFAALGITATSSTNVMTLQWPSVAPPQATALPYSTSSTAVAQVLTIATNVSGGATETLTVAAGATGSPLGSAITALGMTQFTYTARWLKLRLTTITGGSVIAIAQGTA